MIEIVQNEIYHDYDRENRVLKMGILKYFTDTGGIFIHRNGKIVPVAIQMISNMLQFELL